MRCIFAGMAPASDGGESPLLSVTPGCRHRRTVGRTIPWLEAKVRGSATFLLMLSRGYVESHWCMDEMKAVLDEA